MISCSYRYSDSGLDGGNSIYDDFMYEAGSPRFGRDEGSQDISDIR